MAFMFHTKKNKTLLKHNFILISIIIIFHMILLKSISSSILKHFLKYLKVIMKIMLIAKQLYNLMMFVQQNYKILNTIIYYIFIKSIILCLIE